MSDIYFELRRGNGFRRKGDKYTEKCLCGCQYPENEITQEVFIKAMAKKRQEVEEEIGELKQEFNVRLNNLEEFLDRLNPSG